MVTWRELLTEAMAKNNESFSHVMDNTMTDEEMDVQFDGGFGCINGIPFTTWTTDFVYFPICYDGREWVGCVARNPNGEPTKHQGG